MNTHENLAWSRRGLVAALVAAGAGSHSATRSSTAPAPVNGADSAALAAQELTRQRLRQRRSPNVALLDHNGRAVRFYDDIMKDRKVVLNVMYSVCSNVCIPATRNLIEARRLLADEAPDLHFVSLTLTPLQDTPAALREYKKLHGIDERWTFLTGRPEQVERVLRALGFLGSDDTDDLLSHSAMAKVCDERHLRWSHVNTLLSGRTIAHMIRFELV